MQTSTTNKSFDIYGKFHYESACIKVTLVILYFNLCLLSNILLSILIMYVPCMAIKLYFFLFVCFFFFNTKIW